MQYWDVVSHFNPLKNLSNNILSYLSCVSLHQILVYQRLNGSVAPRIPGSQTWLDGGTCEVDLNIIFLFQQSCPKAIVDQFSNLLTILQPILFVDVKLVT